MKRHETRNDLASNVKSVSIDLLNARVADCIDLALVTKQAHWNLRGREFIAVHEMLDGFRTELDGNVDTMAERVVQLGGMALGTTQVVAKGTSLAPYPLEISSIPDHLHALIERYGDTANKVRKSINQAAESGVVQRDDHLLGKSLEHDHVGRLPGAWAIVNQNEDADGFFAIAERDGEDGVGSEVGDGFFDRLQRGRLGSVGDGERIMSADGLV